MRSAAAGASARRHRDLSRGDIDLPDDMAEAFWLGDTRSDGELAELPRLALRRRDVARHARSGRRSGRSAVAVIPSVARPTGGAWYEGTDLSALARGRRHHRGVFLRAECRSRARRRLGRASAADRQRGTLRGILRPGYPGSQQPRRGRRRPRAALHDAGIHESPSTITATCAAAASAGSRRARRARRVNVEFQGKVVAITGAAGGIGQELCRHFGGEGAEIVAIDRSETVKDFAARAARGRASGSSRRSSTSATPTPVGLAFARARRPRSARSTSSSTTPASRRNPSLERTTPEGFARRRQRQFERRLQLRPRGAAGDEGAQGGVIVNIGSVNGLAALGDAAYSAGKAGMISLTRSMALEYGRYGIRVNIVCPGNGADADLERPRSTAIRKCSSGSQRWYPLGRIVEPIEVAKRASPSSPPTPPRRSPASVLPVDCGLTAGNIVMARELTLEDF